MKSISSGYRGSPTIVSASGVMAFDIHDKFHRNTANLVLCHGNEILAAEESFQELGELGCAVAGLCGQLALILCDWHQLISIYQTITHRKKETCDTEEATYDMQATSGVSKHDPFLIPHPG